MVLRDILGYEFRISRKMLGCILIEYGKKRADSNRIFQEYIESSGSKNFRLLPHTRGESIRILTNSDRPEFLAFGTVILVD